MTSDSVTFKTPKGNNYTYFIHSPDTAFKNIGGNYAFGYRGNNGWIFLYVGQTNDLGKRLSNHETWPDAMKKGATHILAHTNSSDQARKDEEAEIIAWLKPACNEKLK